MGFDVPQGAIFIPYFTEEGHPILYGAAGEHYGRFRKIGVLKDNKYWQPPGTTNHAYLTPGVPWGDIAHDIEMPLVFTEGEFKAAKACLHTDFPPTVGFGGVWNWKGRATGLTLVDEISNWQYEGRTVYICFDADQYDNSKVQHAQSALNSVLHYLGAKVMILHLGRTGFKSKGLDDFLQEGGTWDILKATAEVGERGLLAEMLLRYGAFQHGEKVIDLETGQLISPHYFHNLHVSNQVIFTTDVPPKRVQVSKLWATHKNRINVRDYVLNPRERFGLVEDYFNLWRGFSREPVRDEHYDSVVDRWQRFVRTMVGPELEGLFHAWVAWFVRNPWSRNYTSWILRSRKQGIGKSLLGETVAAMIGTGEGYAARILGTDDLFHKYPTYAEGTIYMCCNEIRSDQSRHSNKMKELRTNDKLVVERKGHQPYLVDNLLNLIITTNESFAYGMSADSRRDIVVECLDGMDNETLTEWKGWIRDEIVPIRLRDDLLSDLLYFYMTDVDVSFYDPTAEAPMTEAKEAMAEASEGGWAVIREEARNIVDMWGGKGVVPGPELRTLVDRKRTQPISDGQWIIFLRLVGEEAGYKASGGASVVKIENRSRRCIIFGPNKVEVEALDRPSEWRRSMELIKNLLSGKL